MDRERERDREESKGLRRREAGRLSGVGLKETNSKS